jgi:photosystem II stability/assembly factor-like uncharacterized protein
MMRLVAALWALFAFESGGAERIYIHSRIPLSTEPHSVSEPYGVSGAQLLDDNGGIVYGERVWVTSDRGNHWYRMSLPGASARYGVLIAHFLSRAFGWTDPGGKIYLTDDGARTWREANFGRFRPLVRTLSFPLNARVGWAAGAVSPDEGQGRDDEPAIFVSRDRGSTWHRQSLPQLPSVSRYGIVGAEFFDLNTGFAVADNGIFHTRDGGVRWTLSRLPARCVSREVRQDGYRMWAAAASGRQTGWISGEGGPGGFLLATHDGGATFCEIAAWSNISLHQLDFVSTRRGWGTDRWGHLYATRDGGASWEAVDTDLRVLILSVLTARHAWLLTPGALYDVGFDRE